MLAILKTTMVPLRCCFIVSTVFAGEVITMLLGFRHITFYPIDKSKTVYCFNENHNIDQRIVVNPAAAVAVAATISLAAAVDPLS